MLYCLIYIVAISVVWDVMVTFIHIALNNSSSSSTMNNSMTPSNMLTSTSDMIMSTATTISNSTIINSTMTLTAKMTESPAATGTVSNNKNGKVIIVSSFMHVTTVHVCSLPETAYCL